jgi:hypothetical protein
MRVDVAIALNPAGALENMDGTATVTVAGSEWTTLRTLFFAFTTRL